MNIFVTGTAGFIASNFINYMVKHYPHYNFVSIDKIDYCSNEKNIKVLDSPNHTFYRGNILDNNLMTKIFSENEFDIIIHFAAQSHVDNSFENTFIFLDDNVKATVNLLEYTKTCKNLKKFIHISTDEVYGEINLDGEVCSVTTRLNPTNPYSASKAAAEYFALSYQKSFKVPLIITRGNNVYGPRQYHDKLVPKCIKLFQEGKKFPIHGNGKNMRSFLYVKDAIRAFENIIFKGEIGKIYNIGTKEEYSVKEVVLNIGRIIHPYKKEKDLIYYVKDRPWNDLRYGIEFNELVKLGWKQRVSFNNGLNKTIDWYKKNM